MDLHGAVIFDEASANIIHFSGTGIAEAKRLEAIGRVCYNSESKITEDSFRPFLNNIIKNGHESVLEHGSFTAKFYVNRAIANEIVRHRLASYSQESTRYCDYSKEIHFILPSESVYWTEERVENFMARAKTHWDAYNSMLDSGSNKQIARDILPLCTATTLIMTANYREWRHFFLLRCSLRAHPDIRKVAIQLLEQAHESIPVIFDGLYKAYAKKGL